jgi:hypothetical protein
MPSLAIVKMTKDIIGKHGKAFKKHFCLLSGSQRKLDPFLGIFESMLTRFFSVSKT